MWWDVKRDEFFPPMVQTVQEQEKIENIVRNCSTFSLIKKYYLQLKTKQLKHLICKTFLVQILFKQ